MLLKGAFYSQRAITLKGKLFFPSGTKGGSRREGPPPDHVWKLIQQTVVHKAFIMGRFALLLEVHTTLERLPTHVTYSAVTPAHAFLLMLAGSKL